MACIRIGSRLEVGVNEGSRLFSIVICHPFYSF